MSNTVYYPNGLKKSEDFKYKGVHFTIRWNVNGNIEGVDTINEIPEKNGPCVVRGRDGYSLQYNFLGVRYSKGVYQWKSFQTPQNWFDVKRDIEESYDNLDKNILQHLDPDSNVNKVLVKSYQDVLENGISPNSPEPYNDKNIHFRLGISKYFDDSDYK